MQTLKTLAAAAALMVSGLASATTTFDNGSYKVVYDETTSFGAISGSWSSANNAVGFNWNVPTSVSLAHNGGPAGSVTFALPSFKLTADAGYSLGGALLGSLGNIVYTEFNGATSITANATVSVNGGPDMVLPATPLGKTPSNAFSGVFSGSASAPLAGVTSIEVKNVWITLSASADSFATITGQTQNQLSFSFQAVPVPEPETYALLLAGLGVVGMLARRRRQA